MSFRDLMYPPITLEGFKALRAKQPKRICFGSTHKNALKRNDSGEWAGSLFVPFTETVAVLLPWRLFPNTGQHGGFRRGIKDNDEFEAIEAWVKTHADLVFIRSLFNTAIATCEHYTAANGRSRIGELEHDAKYIGNASAKGELAKILNGAFNRLYKGLEVEAVLSVPSSKSGTEGLPNFLAATLSATIGRPDLTSQLRWNGPKSSIKELKVDEKWGALESVGLTVGEGISGKNLLLIDDMYQSGATAHFVASRLRAAGANEIHLLAISKGKRDTDNS